MSKLYCRYPHLCLWFIFLWLFHFSPVAKADFFLHSWENQHEKKSFWKIQLEGNNYIAPSNWDETGKIFKPNTLQGYNRIQPDLLLAFGITGHLSLFGRISWAYIQQTSTLRPGTGFGFADQTLGANYRMKLPKEDSFIDFQIQGDIPFYDNTISDTQLTPALGDGSIDFTGGFFATFPLCTIQTGILSGVFGAGYTYRTAGFSSAIPGSFVLQYAPQFEGLFLSIATLGIGSLRSDPNNLTTNQTLAASRSGGSYFTSSTQASLLQIRAEAGYHFKNSTNFYLSFTQTIWGQNAPNALNIALGLQFQLQNHQQTEPTRFNTVNYSLEANILASNDRLNLVKIDKGSQDGIEVGQIFDIFSVNKEKFLGNAIARGRVSHVKLGEAAIEITEYYREIWIEESFIAKRLIQ